MHNKPNFFIIGAPKCGTTSLSKWLDQHPNVFFSKPKEPAFFNKDFNGGVTSLKKYLQLFKNANDSHLAIGEGTTHYLYSECAIKNILNFQPDAKFIICLRNPLNTAISMHSERVFQGEEPEKSFEKAWNLEKDREKSIGIPLSMKGNSLFLQYGKLCKHAYWVEKVFAKVKRHNILILLIDDLKESPRNTFNEVCNFLNISEEVDVEFATYNTAKQVKSIQVSKFIHFSIFIKRKLLGNYKTNLASFFRKVNTYQGPNKKMSKKFKKIILDYFIEDILILESLISRNLDSWKK